MNQIETLAQKTAVQSALAHFQAEIEQIVNLAIDILKLAISVVCFISLRSF